MAFDPKQPHGVITGDLEGRKYEQNGKHYDHEGKEWRDPRAPGGKPMGQTKSEPEVKKAPDAAVAAQIAAQA